MRSISSLGLSLLLVVAALQHNSCEAFVLNVADDQEIEVTSNPHDTGASCSRGGGVFLDKVLEPYQLVVTPMVTQADTFMELKYAKVLTVPVPVYRMKQPSRLSAKELEFQMVLVKELSAAGSQVVKEVPWPMEKAKDSWSRQLVDS